jgi:type VI secretion system protein VasD
MNRSYFSPPRFARSVLVSVMFALAACATGSSDRTARVRTHLSAAADVNPDAANRASPLVVRVFELRGDAEFTGADFFALYERERETLGASLITREEYVLRPGEKREVKLPMAEGTRFLAAIAAYRDIRAARWRAIVPAPRKTMGDTFSRDRIVLDAGKGGITLTVKD